MRETFVSMVKAVGTQAGAELAPEGNACELVFDDLPVTLHYLEAMDDIMLYCVVGTVPEKDEARLALFSSLLEANFFFRATAGSTLSVDIGSGLVAMQRVIPAKGLEEVDFLNALESYLNMAMLWRERCGTPGGETPASGDAPPASAAQQGWMMA